MSIIAFQKLNMIKFVLVEFIQQNATTQSMFVMPKVEQIVGKLTKGFWRIREPFRLRDYL